MTDEFKNFHRLLCERFSYVHDDKDWRRDQLSLIEHIASKGGQAERAPRAELSDARIREVIAGIYGTCATDQEMRLARALLAASKEPK